MDGGVAQLGEHLPCKQGVMGSIPIISTIFKAEVQSASGLKIELMRKRSHRRKHVFCRIRRRYKREAVPVDRIWVQIPITGQARTQQLGDVSTMRYCEPREFHSGESREGDGQSGETWMGRHQQVLPRWNERGKPNEKRSVAQVVRARA